MTGVWIALSLVLVLLLLGQLRVGAIVEYGQDGLGVRLRLGPVRIGVFPVKPGKKSKEKTKKTKPAKEKKPLGGRVKPLVQLLPAALDTVKKLFGQLRADKLELLLTISCPDPADTAIRYGQANALLASLWGPLTQALEVQDGHAHVELDYEQGQTSAYVYLSLYLKLWQLLTLAVVFGGKVLFVLIKNRSAVRGASTESEVV